MSLSSERLIYKKCVSSDVEDYLLFGTNAEVMRYVTPRPLTREQAVRRFEKAMVINGKNKKLGYWLAYHKTTKEPVAFLKLVKMGLDYHEIGYLILPKYWRQRYGSELACAVVEYACSLEEVSRLMGIVRVENKPSKRLLKKCGFEFLKTGVFEGAKAEFYKLDV